MRSKGGWRRLQEGQRKPCDSQTRSESAQTRLKGGRMRLEDGQRKPYNDQTPSEGEWAVLNGCWRNPAECGQTWLDDGQRS